MILTRRSFVRSICAIPLALAAQPARNRLKILVTGGHPGDPECGCGGTIARCSTLGHEIVLLYLNKGEGFCHGGNDCGSIRTIEAQKACQLLGARPVFAGQIDGKAIVDNSHYDDFRRLVDAQKPDLILAQWPIDQHRDHRAVSQLALDAWIASGRKSAFYYYEVADDTQMFTATEFVDISATDIQATRRAACYVHASQEPDKWFPRQLELTRFRGTQSGFPQAEAFVRHWQSRTGFLP